MTNYEAYGKHLDECAQCEQHPFAHCAVGQVLLRDAATDPEGEAPLGVVTSDTGSGRSTGPEASVRDALEREREKYRKAAQQSAYGAAYDAARAPIPPEVFGVRDGDE